MNVFRWGGLVVLVGLVGVMPAAAGPPTEQLRQYTDQVLKLLEDPNLQGPDRRAAVRKAAIENFDVQETAKRALGRHWQARRPARGARSSTPLRKREDQPWRRPDSATSPSRPS